MKVTVLQIQEFYNIAEESENYNQFIRKICDLLGVGKFLYKDFADAAFVTAVIRYGAKTDDINQSDIRKVSTCPISVYLCVHLKKLIERREDIFGNDSCKISNMDLLVTIGDIFYNYFTDEFIESCEKEESGYIPDEQ